MKKLSVIFFATLAIGLSLTSCNSDDIVNKAGDPAVAAEQNATESNKISAETLEQGILIGGAAKKSGNPPAPNSNIDFQLNEDVKTALQKNGLNIKFSSTSDIAGAYIRFKDSDGNGASSYFNVSADIFENKSSKKSLSNKNRVFKSKKTDDTSINVDFSTIIPAGVFCYDICIYDSVNNISAIQTACVTVEAWGGNAELVGDWTYVGSSEDDKKESVDCNNGNNIDVLFSKIINRNIDISFNEDGSYNDYVKGESLELDWEETINNCSPVYYNTPEKYEAKRNGNWAYDQRDNKLSIVMFKYQDILTPAESFDIENGELVTDGLTVKELTNEILVIEEEINFSGGSINISENIIYTFKRK